MEIRLNCVLYFSLYLLDLFLVSHLSLFTFFMFCVDNSLFLLLVPQLFSPFSFICLVIVVYCVCMYDLCGSVRVCSAYTASALASHVEG